MKTRFICSAVYARERFHGLRMIHSSLTVNKIITKSASILSQIYDHPFNYQLKAGSLPIKSFQHYIEQDRHYLRKFALALQIASERLTVQSHKHKFKQFAGDMLETERELHEKYLGKLLPYSLFSQSKNSQQKEITGNSPITHAIYCIRRKIVLSRRLLLAFFPVSIYTWN